MYQIECYILKWMETLPQDHEMKQAMIQILQEEMKNTSEENWTERDREQTEKPAICKTVVQAGAENRRRYPYCGSRSASEKKSITDA